MTAKASDKFSSLLPIFSQYLNQPPQKIAIFEEIRPDMIDRVVTEKTFDDGEILNGDILCFQIDFDANQVAALPEPAFAFAPTYYEFLSNKVEIEFVPEFPEQVGGLKGVSLMLSKIMTLDKVLMKLGQHLEHDPSKIKLSMPSGNTKVPIKSNDPVTLGEILGYYMYSKQNGAARIIYFELLDISLTELESKRALNLSVLDTTFKETGPLEFLVSKLAKMTDLCELVKQKMNLQSAEFRIFEVLNSRKVKTFLPTDTVSILNEYATLYFQIIPKSEQEILSGEKEGFVVEGFHFAKDTYRGHGIPFTIEVFKVWYCLILGRHLQCTKRSHINKTFNAQKRHGKGKACSCNQKLHSCQVLL